MISKVYNQINLKRKSVCVGNSVSVRRMLRLVAAQDAQIQIGDNVVIRSGWKENSASKGQQHTLFNVRAGARLIVADGAGISNSTIVVSESVYIGKKVYIVVTKSVPADELWGGNPARFLRK